MVIRFHGASHEHYGWLSNFSPWEIVVNGQCWPSVEHFYQAMKFPHDPERQQRIRRARSALKAKQLAWKQTAQPRSDWDEVKDGVMRKALAAKFSQHEELQQKLLATGDEELVEHSAKDSYWGDGGDDSGTNRLGELLMELRARLRGDDPSGDSQDHPHRRP